jgi:hypothetical protein
VRELQALAQTQPADTKEFFKNEIALAIRDINDEYEAIAHQNKADMESWYKLKVLYCCVLASSDLPLRSPKFKMLKIDPTPTLHSTGMKLFVLGPILMIRVRS